MHARMDHVGKRIEIGQTERAAPPSTPSATGILQALGLRSVVPATPLGCQPWQSSISQYVLDELIAPAAPKLPPSGLNGVRALEALKLSVERLIHTVLIWRHWASPISAGAAISVPNTEIFWPYITLGPR